MLSKISLRHFASSSLNNFMPKKIDFSSICSVLPNQFTINPIYNHHESQFQRFFSIQTNSNSQQNRIELLKEKADSGDRDSQYELGSYYLSNENNKMPDNEKGVHYIKLAAENNHPTACYLYSTYLKNGFHVQKDLDASFKYLTYAADHNLEIAQFELALEYYTGKRIKSDMSKAIHYFLLSADNGNVASCETVGSFLMLGIGCKPDIKLATKYLEIGSKLNSALCKYQLSVIKNIDNEEESIRLLKESADLGYSIAQHEYSKYLLFRKKDEKGAEKYLRLAANQNDSQSCIELSNLLKRSKNAIKKREGFLFLKRSADLENEAAMIELGKILCGENSTSFGFQVKTDINLALKYLKKAAEQSNNPEASIEYASRLGDYLNSPSSSGLLDVDRVTSECIQFYDKGIKNAKQFQINDPRYWVSYANFLMSRDKGDDANNILILYDYIKNPSPIILYTIAVVRSKTKKPFPVKFLRGIIDALFTIPSKYKIDKYINLNPPSENYEKYFNMLKSKVEENPSDLRSKLSMALLMSIGAGTKHDLNKALEIIKECSNSGDSVATKIYSYWLLENVDGSQKDPEKLMEALDICKKAADEGDSDLQYLYGKLKLNGSSFVQANAAEGVQYLEKAATDNRDAAYMLGALYSEGISVEKNLPKAQEYFQIADEMNHPQAKEALEILKKNK